MEAFKQILKPIASLRITVVLLLASMLLIFAGTLAQRDFGIETIKDTHFHTWFAWIRVHDLVPFIPVKLPGAFPFPGGWLLIVAMLINLTAAHTLRFPFTWKDVLLLPPLGASLWLLYLLQFDHSWLLFTGTAVASALFIAGLFWLHAKRAGVILLHLGLVLVLAGELVSSVFQVESQMSIEEGTYANYSEDYRTPELVFVDPSAGGEGQEAVAAVPGQKLRTKSAKKIAHPQVPAEVEVLAWYSNSKLVGLGQQPADAPKATAGAGLEAAALNERPVAGVAGEASKVDFPSAYVRLRKGDKDLGTYLVSYFLDAQPVTIGDKTYELSLRATRHYKPFRIYLKDFSFKRFVGTEVAKDYTSIVRLVDEKEGVDREVRIWMNHPLRYKGEVYFQSNFTPDERSTVLQVVRNPGLYLPYYSCSIVAGGMAVHFVWLLVGFLRRTAKGLAAITAVGPAGELRPAVLAAQAAARHPRGKGKAAAASATADSYTLNPTPTFLRPTLWFPVLMVLVAIAVYYFAGRTPGYMKPGAPLQIRTPDARIESPVGESENEFTVKILATGKSIPVPLDAPNSDVIFRGRPAQQADLRAGQGVWIMQPMLPGDRARVYVDTLPPGQFDFAGFARIPINHEGRPMPMESLARDLMKVSSESETFTVYGQPWALGADRDKEKRPQVEMLLDHMVRSTKLFDYELYRIKNPELLGLFGLKEQQKRYSFSQLAPKFEEFRKQVNAAAAKRKVKADSLNGYERDLLELAGHIEMYDRVQTPMNLFVIPPHGHVTEWQTLMQAISSSARNESDNPYARQFLKILRAYGQYDPPTFNAAVAEYHKLLEQDKPAGTKWLGLELAVRRFDPFHTSMWIYGLMVFPLAALSWIGWSKPLRRAAMATLLLAFLIHTAGLVARFIITGRPPVTTLYTSAIFIAWGGIFVAIIMEFIFRRGIAMAAASIMGFVSLIVASALYMSEGDTMKQLQAVLDTNLWLWVHVQTVTLGYMATFLAGMLGIAYLVGTLFFAGFDAEGRRMLSKAIYGVLAFAMLFSFIGTTTGGIWADQSWGRFWGWDPKENGAILIVAWNAIVLHARWAGLVRERGVAVLTIVGIAVTVWSWFGTNQLGVGLHSYGFTDGTVMWLTITWGICAAIALLGGLLPKSAFAALNADAERAQAVREAVPIAKRAR